jgi:FkbM family methyltransferase
MASSSPLPETALAAATSRTAADTAAAAEPLSLSPPGHHPSYNPRNHNHHHNRLGLAKAATLALLVLLLSYQYRILKSAQPPPPDDSSQDSRNVDLLLRLHSEHNKQQTQLTTPRIRAGGTGSTGGELGVAVSTAAGAPAATDSGGGGRGGNADGDEIVDCLSYLRDADVSSIDPNAGMDRTQLRTRTRPVEPAFYISLHHRNFDKTRWGIMETGQYYERGLEKIWRHQLAKAPPRSVVLDVGANIGYFTLVSLAIEGDHEVHSFEPNPANLLRLCESLQLNNWTYPNRQHYLHSSGVSDSLGLLPFAPEPLNPGMGRFFEDEASARQEGVTYTLKKLLTLDLLAVERGWIPREDSNIVNGRSNGKSNGGGGDISSGGTGSNGAYISILKIDVEGQEHRVLAGARRLLKSHQVKNLFMEVSVRTLGEKNDSRTGLKTLVDAGYVLVGQGGWMGPVEQVSWPQDARLVDSIIEQAKTHPAMQLNVWFQPAPAAPP